jgi:hypothetical protein
MKTNKKEKFNYLMILFVKNIVFCFSPSKKLSYQNRFCYNSYENQFKAYFEYLLPFNA